MPNSLLVAGMGKKNVAMSANLASLTPVGTRRIGHGGTLRSLAFGAERLRQPQDGAPINRTKLASITAQTPNDVLQEPEDARLTGGTRSLTRRLLGLNVEMKKRGVVAMVAGAIAQPKVA